MKAIIVLCASFLLAGCMATHSLKPPVYTTKSEVFSAIETNHDSFKGTTWLVGPDLLGSNVLERYCLRHLKGTEIVQLYYYDSVSIGGMSLGGGIYTSSGDWRFWDSAYDSQQTKLEVIQIDRSVGDNFISEHIAIALSPDYLIARSNAGLSIKIYGDNVPQGKILTVPPHYVQGFVEAINSK